MLIIGCCLYFAGCSKPQTLSGVFFDTISNSSLESEKTYDFRTDGTVIYKSYAHGVAKEVGFDMVIEQNGKGTYSIKDGVITANISYTVVTSDRVKRSSETEHLTSAWIFKLEGEDLLAVSKDKDVYSEPKRLPRKR